MKLSINLTLLSLLVATGTTIAEPLEKNCSASSNKSVTVIDTRSSGSPEGPRIQVAADRSLDIDLLPQSGAHIDIDSIRIRYSIFDITRKVVEQVGQLSPSMTVTSELLPPGRYRISIQVYDNEGHDSHLKLTLLVSEDSARSCNASAAPRSQTQSISS